MEKRCDSFPSFLYCVFKNGVLSCGFPTFDLALENAEILFGRAIGWDGSVRIVSYEFDHVFTCCRADYEDIDDDYE